MGKNVSILFSLKNMSVLGRFCQAFGFTYFASKALQLK